MHDAGGRRDYAEVVQRPLTPLEKLVALAVALEFALGVVEERKMGAKPVDLHRVVDHQVHRDLRVDAARVAAQPGHRRAHRRQIDHGRHAGEVLQDYPARFERQLHGGHVFGVPIGQPDHVLLGDLEPIDLAQERLQQQFDRERQARHMTDAGLLQGAQPVVAGRFGAPGEQGPGAEGVLAGICHGCTPWESANQRISELANQRATNGLPSRLHRMRTASRPESRLMGTPPPGTTHWPAM